MPLRSEQEIRERLKKAEQAFARQVSGDGWSWMAAVLLKPQYLMEVAVLRWVLMLDEKPAPEVKKPKKWWRFWR